MLDRVCTDLIGLHGKGRWGNYASVAQWMGADKRSGAQEATTISKDDSQKPETNPQRTGLNYHEKKEFAAMEETILAAEEELARVQTALDEANASADHAKLQERFAAHKEAQEHVDALYARWEELETNAS